ncbi:MAG: hypothetical protein P4L92_03350 [Rudaea sp.]|nr:hypothetical protein [Rudaea sp.]
MPRGDKSSYTSKQKRQAGDIEKSYERKGVSEKESERRAWATVNKTTGGGLKKSAAKKSASRKPAPKKPAPAKSGAKTRAGKTGARKTAPKRTTTKKSGRKPARG